LHLNLSQCFESLYVPSHHHLLLRYTSNSVREMGGLLPTIIDCGMSQVLHPNLSQCSGALYVSLHHHHCRLRCTSKQSIVRQIDGLLGINCGFGHKSCISTSVSFLELYVFHYVIHIIIIIIIFVFGALPSKHCA
jgi:hypothetical protein